MAIQWEMLKVFISSTFRDLELARDSLAHTFYDIEKDIFERQLTVRPYDLRWRDYHGKKPIVDWCLNMVAQCQYFVGILGNRYGWRPPTGPDGKENYQRISITEMEINYALANIDPEQRFFCFTDFSSQQNEESKEDSQSLQTLKNRLEDAGEKVFHCQSIEELLTTIGCEFKKIIDAKFPPGKKVAPIAYTFQDMIDEFIAEKVRGFVGREEYLQQLQQFAHSTQEENFLGICAIAGTGKSSLLASFIERWQSQQIPLVAHFLGMGGNSREISGIIDSLATQLRELGIIQEIKSDPMELYHQVHNSLQQTQQRLVLVIDGIDEVSDDGRELKWLPQPLPSQVRVIVTSRPVDTWKSLQQFAHIQNLELPPLTDAEISTIINNYNQQHNLQLSSQECELLQQRAEGSPLFLKVALDEILASGTAVGQLAVTIQALFEQILSRLQQQHGELVADYLGFIASGRSGVSEKELGEIFHVGDDVLLTVTQALQNFIITRRGLLNFFHGEFERAIKIRIGKAGMRKYHRNFAQYLEDKGFQYIRTVAELPYQWQWGEEYEKLLQLLTNLDFLEAKCRANMAANLSSDMEFATGGIAVSIPHNLRVEVSPGIGVNKETIALLHRALDLNLQFLQCYPEFLFQTLWNYGYWHDCPEAENHYQLADAEHQPPWQQPGDKLHHLVKHWSKHKNQEPWLRALRPMAARLDSPILKIFRGHDDSVRCVAFSPDGSKVASGSHDDTVRIWDASTGETLQVLDAHEGLVRSIAFNYDGSKIASGAHDSTVRIWDTQNGALLHTLTGHKNYVNSVRFTTDGEKVVSGSHDSSVKIWDVATGQLLHTLEGHQGEVRSIDSHGTKIVSGARDNLIYIWDIQTASLTQTFKGHKGHINSVKFSFDGAKIVSGSHDKTIRVWKIDGTQLFVLTEHQESVETVEFSRDHTKILSGSYDNTLRIWNAEQGTLLKTIRSYEKDTRVARFNPGGEKIVSGSDDNTVRIWDASSDSIQYQNKGHTKTITEIKFSPDNKVISGAEDHSLCVWDVSSGKLLHTLTGHDKQMKSACFSPDSSKIIAGSDDNIIRMWSSSGEFLHSFVGHEKYVRSVAFSPDSKLVVSGSYDNTVRIWNAANGQLLHTLKKHQSIVEKVIFGPYKSEKIASCSADKTICIWSIDGQLHHVFSGHESIVTDIVFSPDGSKIASCSADKTVRIWETTGKLIHTLSGHRGTVEEVKFSPDGQQLASKSFDKTLRIWNCNNGECLRVIDGEADLAAIVASIEEIPYQAISREEEMVIETKKEGYPIIFFPGAMEKVTISPQKDIVGSINNHICMFALENALVQQEMPPESEQLIKEQTTATETKLTILNGRQAGACFSLKKDDKVILGRDNSCQVQVLDKGISRNHTLIEDKGDHFLVVDLGSTNGTFVNNKVIVSKQLVSGDIIKIGQSELLFEEITSLESAKATEIEIRNGRQAGQRFTLNKDSKIILGRDNSCHIQVLDKGIGRNHALIEDKGDHFLLVDLGSTNGTFVNSKIIISKELADGDIIKMGQAEMIFHDTTTSAGFAEQDFSLEQEGTLAQRYDDIKYSLGEMFHHELKSKFEHNSTANAYIEALYEFNCVLNAHLEKKPLQQAALEKIAQIFKATRASLIFIQRDSYEVTVSIGKEAKISRGLLNKTIQERLAVLSKDVCNDPTTAGMSIVALKLQTIMCVPIETAGECYGALYVQSIDSSNQSSYAEKQLCLLAAMGKQLGIAIKRSKELDDFAQEKQQKLNKAIHESLLPVYTPEEIPCEFAAVYVGCEECGGDYYDIWPISDTSFALVIADVTGHGMKALLTIIKVRSMLQGLKTQEFGLCALIETLNELLEKECEDDQFVTLLYGEIDIKTQTIHYVNAGHDNPLLFRKAQQEFEFLESTGIPIGMMDDFEYEEGEPVTFSQGDLLILSTDGITETMNMAGEQFGEERFLEIIRRCHNKSMHQLCKECLDALKSFRGEKRQHDDITLVALKF